MKVQAEVSLYPLRTQDVGGAVAQFIQYLRATELDLDAGPMSTRISGEPKEVFDALRRAFVRLAEQHEIVLTIKASNACPASGAPVDSARRE